MIVTRFRASGIHFLVSGVVAILLLWFLTGVWYPSPLFEALGGHEIYIVLLGIDVVLGPLLTLLVFKPGKPSLKLDLAVIVALQVAALAYGIFTLYEGRPVYIAALGSRFEVVTANTVDPKELETAKQALPLWGPKWVAIKSPSSVEERQRVLLSSIGGLDYGHFPQHHQPIQNTRLAVLAESLPLTELYGLNHGREQAINEWLMRRGLAVDGVRFQGLKARSQDMAVILDSKSGEVAGIAPFNPW